MLNKLMLLIVAHISYKPLPSPISTDILASRFLGTLRQIQDTQQHITFVSRTIQGAAEATLETLIQEYIDTFDIFQRRSEDKRTG